MKKVILTSSVIAALGAGFLYAANAALSIPDVYVSYSTDECVNVVNYREGDDYTCENMPKKFNHVWVQ